MRNKDDKINKMKKIILVLFLINLLFLSCSDLKKNSTKNLLVQGCISKIEYLQGNFSAEEKTIIYFKDGTTCILKGHHSIVYQCITVYTIRDAWKVVEYVFEEYNQ